MLDRCLLYLCTPTRNDENNSNKSISNKSDKRAISFFRPVEIVDKNKKRL